MRQKSMAASLCISALLASVTFAAMAKADDQPVDPKSTTAMVSGSLSAEFLGEWRAPTNGSEMDYFNAETTIDGELTVTLSDYLSLNAALSFGSLDDPVTGEDRFFGKSGIQTESLFLQLDVEAYTIAAGKIAVPFGLAWDKASGIYGTDLAEDYEIDERIGLLVRYRFGETATIQHQISASAFFLDTSILSDTAINSHGRQRRSDGGVSNTGKPNSVALAYDGQMSVSNGELLFHAGMSLQQAGRRDMHDEVAWAGGIYGEHELTDQLEMEWVSEYVFVRHAEGSTEDKHYMTLAGKLSYEDVWLAPALTWVRTMEAAERQHEILATFSVGWDVTEEITLSAGYKFQHTPDLSEHTIGIQAEYDFKF